LVGHSLENDLRAMKLVHSRVIDSSVLYMRKNGTKLKLKNLADKILNVMIVSFSEESNTDSTILSRIASPLSTSFEQEYRIATMSRRKSMICCEKWQQLARKLQ
jgi:hypothetical protein